MPRGGKRNAYPGDFKQSAIELVLNDDRNQGKESENNDENDLNSFIFDDIDMLQRFG